MPRSLTNHLKPGVGKRLKKSREAMGLSQRELAFPGCTAAYISRIEAEARNPSMQMVHELARRLNVDPHWLATGEEMTPSRERDLREQLRMAHAEIRELRAKLDAIGVILPR